MQFFNHRIPWQILVLIALLLAGCGENGTSKSVGNNSLPQTKAPSMSMIIEQCIAHGIPYLDSISSIISIWSIAVEAI